MCLICLSYDSLCLATFFCSQSTSLYFPFPLRLSFVSPPYLPRLLQIFRRLRHNNEIIYSRPLALVSISIPAESVNLSHGYRRWVVKLSFDSLQQDDHKTPSAQRIRTVIMISNGGPNVLLHCNSLYCSHSTVSCMTHFRAQKDDQPKFSCREKLNEIITAPGFNNLLFFTVIFFVLSLKLHTAWPNLFGQVVCFKAPTQNPFGHMSALASEHQTLPTRLEKRE